MERMKLTVTTLSPVVIPATSDTTVMTATQDYFSGTVLRGVLAAAYIRQNRLKGKAHEDKAFQQLFFGDLRFVDAYPSLKGERGIVLPLSLQKDKAGTEICDLFEPKADMAGYKSCRGIGLVRPKQEKILSLPVRKRVSLHMSREKEDERISGRSEDGDIYNYEAIEPGQEFFHFFRHARGTQGAYTAEFFPVKHCANAADNTFILQFLDPGKRLVFMDTASLGNNQKRPLFERKFLLQNI